MRSLRRPEQVKALHILVGSEKEAFDILKQVRRGAPFEELARDYSKGTEAKQGGDLGYFSRGVLPEFFDNAVFPLKVGKVSKVVTSEFGYHLFKLIDRRKEKVRDFESCKKEIENVLNEEKRKMLYTTWLEKQLKDTKIMKNSELLAQLF